MKAIRKGTEEEDIARFCTYAETKTILVSITHSLTNKLRYKKCILDLGNGTQREEFILQQMYRGSDGSEEWKCVEYVQ